MDSNIGFYKNWIKDVENLIFRQSLKAQGTLLNQIWFCKAIEKVMLIKYKEFPRQKSLTSNSWYKLWNTFFVNIKAYNDVNLTFYLENFTLNIQNCSFFRFSLVPNLDLMDLNIPTMDLPLEFIQHEFSWSELWLWFSVCHLSLFVYGNS